MSCDVWLYRGLSPRELAILLLCRLGTARVLDYSFISGTGATVLSWYISMSCYSSVYDVGGLLL